MTMLGVDAAFQRTAAELREQDMDEEGRPLTPWRRLMSRFVRNRAGMIGLVFLLIVLAVAMAAPLVAPQDPAHVSLTQINQGPSSAHWLGTDDLGRDILSRLIYGARVSMRVAGLVVLLAAAAALPIGLLAGYFGRAVDASLMR